MAKSNWRVFDVSMFVLIVATSAAGQSIDVKGTADTPRTVSAADLSTLPRSTLSAKQHDQMHAFEGVAVSSILELVRAPLGTELRGKELANVVLVKGSDGYVVALALAEIDPAMQAKKIILADRMDSAPLPPDRGPFQLIVEGDIRPARAVRMVVTFEIINLATPSAKK